MPFGKFLLNKPQRKKLLSSCDFRRKLRLETLEDRRMLAVMFVNDLGDGTLTSLAGDGKLSLREAIEAINTAGPVDGIGSVAGLFGLNDSIRFDLSMFEGAPKTLKLLAGPLELQSKVTLLGPGSSKLTIDAQLNSRIIDIPSSTDEFSIGQLSLTGGLTTGFAGTGGAIRSRTTGRLIVNGVDLAGNATTGDSSPGGAIAATGQVTLVDSRVMNNHTEGANSNGGAIFSSTEVSLSRSTIAKNWTEGTSAGGGGVSAGGNVTISSSTVSGNRTQGTISFAGGVLAVGDVQLIESTISGNQTEGNNAFGGGINAGGTITVTRSTIVNNQVLGPNVTGGGIRTGVGDIVLSGAIIANNSASGGHTDIEPGSGTLTVSYSLIGNATGLGIPAATNLLNRNPRLGPLSGGGQTQTHAPLPDSPVIDAGDPLLEFPPASDQRGAPFSRVANGVIDIGSHEVQSAASADFDADNDVDGSDFLAWQRGFSKMAGAVLADGNTDQDADVDAQDLAVWQVQFAGGNRPNADFDEDNDVDGSDFLAWQRGFGQTTGAVSSEGDADGDNDVDSLDLATWQTQFGGGGAAVSSLPPVPVQQPLATVADRTSLIDLAIAIELGTADESEPTDFSQPSAVAETAPRELAFAAISPASAEQAASSDFLAEARISQYSAADDEGLLEELVVVAL